MASFYLLSNSFGSPMMPFQDIFPAFATKFKTSSFKKCLRVIVKNFSVSEMISKIFVESSLAASSFLKYFDILMFLSIMIPTFKALWSGAI
jgi:hypothetical protein